MNSEKVHVLGMNPLARNIRYAVTGEDTTVDNFNVIYQGISPDYPDCPRELKPLVRCAYDLRGKVLSLQEFKDAVAKEKGLVAASDAITPIFPDKNHVFGYLVACLSPEGSLITDFERADRRYLPGCLTRPTD